MVTVGVALFVLLGLLGLLELIGMLVLFVIFACVFVGTILVLVLVPRLEDDEVDQDVEVGVVSVCPVALTVVSKEGDVGASVELTLVVFGLVSLVFNSIVLNAVLFEVVG